ncbi:MAG: hypothetical protein ACQEUZ_09385 [Pseudomonadota bacterium]
MDGQGQDGPSAEPGTERLVADYLDAIRLAVDALSALRGAGDQRAPGSEGEILLLLARAQAAWLTGGLRYWREIADILARGGEDLADAALKDAAAPDDGDDDEAERARRRMVLLDKARASLREIGEVSVSEAEALRARLLEIESELREMVDGGPETEPRRRARPKP